MPKPEQLLEAGALLAPKTKLKDAAGIDEVSARAYRHPALGDRVVVRLTPDNLAAGEDLTLSFLGFAEPDVTGPVAVRRRQALGFPEWALVHDPAHARYALDMVKEFKREARRAKSKPGHAWDAFSEIAKSLGKSVAHFLPSFWEQVGREFIAIDNSTYASRAFGKAREAERVHGLKVDEAIRRDAFLEFALAGCVSASAINDYGKELQAAGEAGEAWSIIRDLSVRRTLGGLPPWKNMCKDLATLAKAAGLDVDTEIQQVVRELLESPAMPRTSMGFWQVASKWVQSLAENDDQAAGLLLNMIPKSGGYGQSDAWTWLNYLETWGILDNSWKDGVSEQAGPVGSPAEWLSKLCAVGSPSQVLFDLVERMADRLKKDDIRVYPYEVNRWNKQLNANIDLLDHLLALGIPIADPEGELRLSMYSWFRVHDDNAKNRPRDPVMLAQDPRFSVALMDAVRESVGVAEFEAAATGKKAMLEVRRNWLLSEIEKFGKAALPGFEDAFSTINGKTTTATWQEFPEAFERLQEAKVAAALHRSLKNGLMDEYGWPALEAAFEHFTGKFSISAPRETASDVKLFGAYPYAVVTDGVAAIVVRGNERVGEFELKLPKGEPLKHVEYIDGDLLVTAGKNYRCKQFWNRSPGKSWETWERDNQGLQGFAIDARGGGAFTGEKIIHAGEPETRGIGSSSNFFFDGEHYWATGWDHASQTETSCELDPVKGEQGRRSLPGFLEDFIAPDTRLMLHRCSLFPLPSGIQHSPLGQKDGLCGFRARKDSVTLQFTAEGIDGRSICTGKDDLSFQALLDQPGTTQKLPIEGVEGRWRTAPHLAFHSPDNQIVTSRPEFDPGMYNSGQPAGVPWRYLNFFEVRDETASKKLRSISLDDTQTLLDAASKDIEAIASKREAKQGKKAENPTYPLLDKAIGKLLPRLKSPRLHAGIRGIIVGAIQLQLSLEKVIAQSDPNRVQPTKITVTNADASVVHVLNMLQKRSYGAESVSFFNELASIVMFLQGESDDITAPDFTCGIFGEIVSESLLNAWQLQWFARDDGDTKWLTFYEALLQTGALSLTGRLRQFSIDEDSDPKFRKLLEDAVGGRHDDIDDREAATALQHGNSKFVITRDWRGFNVVEFSRSETFHPVTGVDSNEETQPLELSDIQESVQQFIDLCKDQPPKIPSADFFAEVAEGMKLKPAIVAYIWFGYPHFGRYGSDPIPAYLREPAGIKAREGKAAREFIQSLPEESRTRLRHALLAGPIASFSHDPPNEMAANLKKAWESIRPDCIELPDSLTELLTHGLHGDSRTVFMEALNRPDDAEILNAKAKYSLQFDADGDFGGVGTGKKEEQEFNELWLQLATHAVVRLAYELPVGDPALAKMAGVLAAVQKATSNPNLLISLGETYHYNDKNENKSNEIATSIVGRLKKTKNVLTGESGGLTVVVNNRRLSLLINPTKLKKDTDIATVRSQMQAAHGDYDSLKFEAIDALKYLRSKDIASLGNRLKKSPVPAGQYEANPALSAAETVSEVAAKLKISAEAATYYLQLLTLPDPTDKNIRTWNGWTPSAITKAAKELLARELIVEAKRARAGRKYFLPGGWEELKAPYLPIETWKLPLFDVTRDENQKVQSLFLTLLPLKPVHELFAGAWQRICENDIPQYEEVTRRKKR